MSQDVGQARPNLCLVLFQIDPGLDPEWQEAFDSDNDSSGPIKEGRQSVWLCLSSVLLLFP